MKTFVALPLFPTNIPKEEEFKGERTKAQRNRQGPAL